MSFQGKKDNVQMHQPPAAFLCNVWEQQEMVHKAEVQSHPQIPGTEAF